MVEEVNVNNILINLVDKTILEKQDYNSERDLHEEISSLLFEMFGVSLIANEYSISFFDEESKQKNGRIDSLGIDENGYPVIIEYKLSKNNNIINQALYYLDWLKSNKRLFELEVEKMEIKSENINFANIRVICIAKNYSKYDYNACKHIDASIELYTYNKYEGLLDINLVYEKNPGIKANIIPIKSENAVNKTSEITFKNEEIEDLYYMIEDKFKDEIGEGLKIIQLKHYISFKAHRNILTLVLQNNNIKCYSNYFDSTDVSVSNVANKGHWGTGNYKFDVKDTEDFKKLCDIFMFKKI